MILKGILKPLAPTQSSKEVAVRTLLKLHTVLRGDGPMAQDSLSWGKVAGAL